MFYVITSVGGMVEGYSNKVVNLNAHDIEDEHAYLNSKYRVERWVLALRNFTCYF